MRLAVAAALAIGIHAALFGIEVPWSPPDLIAPRSQDVRIDLVAFVKPVEKPHPAVPKATPPKPKPKKTKPRPVPAPVIKPAARPRPVPPAPPPESLPETPEPDALPPQDQTVSEAGPAEAPAPEAPSEATADDSAAVQVSVPLYDINPPPRYPRAARKRNYQGTVVLEVRVTADGSVAEVRINQSSGYAILDRSAVKSVKGWRFSPALRAGRPIEMWVHVPIRYELN